MNKEVLKWLDKKKEYMDQMMGKGTDTETKEWVFKQFIEVVTLEQQLREKNQELIEVTMERDQLVNRIQQIIVMIEQVVEAKLMDISEQIEKENTDRMHG